MDEPVEVVAARLIDEASDRGAQKRLGRLLDADPGLRMAVLAEARARGVDLPVEARDFAGKRLLRLAQDRQRDARVRKNPIRRDDAFTCAGCGEPVTPGGARVRDHCPSCLCSLHVDVVPGDRASTCRGLLRPSSVHLVAGEPVVRYRCVSCGHEGQNRAHPDDDPRVLARLSVAS